MTSIVITGANGFIGRLLADRLTVGTEVTFAGKARTISRRILVDQHIPHAAADNAAGNAEWIKGDLGASCQRGQR